MIEKKNNIKNIVKTCGKLYIGGEYSILTPEQSAIIKNVNIYMTGTIEKSEISEYKIYSDMFNYFVTMDYDKNYSLIQETITIVNEYLLINNIKEIPFKLTISGKMEKNGKKFGIGSSGSVVVLTIKAMDKFYNLNLSKEQIFKLSSYVLLKRGDSGSMGDIACISYENLILYKSFNREKISKLIKENSLKNMLEINWGYKIEEMNCNIECEFLVGWTKEPAISNDMIKIVKSSIDNNFLINTEKEVQNLKIAFKNGKKEIIKEKIKNISNLLVKLNKNIYSDKLLKLVKDIENLDICGKSSGAGGGDCGIALSFNNLDSENLIKKWEKNDIELLYREKL